MATPNVGILTTAGKALIDKANSGQAKISFSKIVFSSMDNSQLSDMQVKALTAIAPQEVVVSSPETTLDTNSGETRIRATGTNEKLADGVYVKTYGVFAKDDTGSEILYGVTVSPNPNYFPAYDGVTPQAVTYSYKTVIQETSNITMTNSNDVYASQEDLTEALQPYAKTVDVNQQLDKKVNIADMRKPASDVAGIEEVSAKQDKIGYTPADDSKVVHTTDTSNWQKQAMFNPGNYNIDGTNQTTDFATLLRSKYNKAGVVYIRDNDWPSNASPVDAVVICEGGSWWYAYGVTPNGNFVHRRIRESDDTGWVINADDSKVVHSTDMRKPASDVAGIEEVNAKQDKIGYTPANDSKVVHSTVTELNSTDMDTVLTAGFYQLNSGTNGMPNVDVWTIYQVIPLKDSNGVQIAYNTNNDILGMRTWNNWNKFTSWVQFADDSKVAHLSGANNFDTVPTVKNNPLLLASSLPSDLARTGSNQEFTGKNTFDTAPIDKTTGNPYITKDGVPKVDLSSYATNIQLATKADDSKVVHRSPDTGRATDATDFPYKDLKVDGYPVIPFVLVPDRKTALAKTAQYPNYAFMYGKELN